MAQYKLTYFDVTALGETLRLMLNYMGVEFEDNRLTFDKAAHLKTMDEIPFGKVPTLEVDGKILHQTTAILRYLAPEAGLAGDNPEENLEIDMIVGAVQDFFVEIQRYMKTQNPEEKQLIHEQLVKIIIPYYLQKFETILKENGGYLANGKLSWADLFASGISGVPTVLGIDILEQYPMFKDLVEKVFSLPGIKEWVEIRPKTRF